MFGAKERPTRVLAVASGGGHWVQLLRVAPGFSDCDVAFVTVNRAYRSDVEGRRFYVVPDATQWNKARLMWMGIRLAWIIAKERPDLIISTGAAPGYFGLLVGRLFRARTAWIDSIANAECLSLSGQKIGKHADLWLTQWEHLSRPEGPHYFGAVL
jgi:hypothetical protein